MHLAPQHTLIHTIANCTQTHTHTHEHTNNLCPRAGAKTVSAGILSEHEMTIGQNSIAVLLQELNTLADTHMRPYTKHRLP